MSNDGTSPVARRRGRPARIDRDRIIAAALGMDPSQVTMQSVADRLGVDRSAVHYHVKSKGELQALVAEAALNAAIRVPELPDGADWRDVLAAFAETMRRAGLAEAEYTPHLKGHLWFPERGLRLTERVLDALVAAGLTAEEAAQVFVLLVRVVVSATRDEAQARLHGDHPALVEPARQVDAAHTEVPAMARFVTDVAGLDADAQFAFSLSFVVAGVEDLLRTRHG